jgi:hypothetical protein
MEGQGAAARLASPSKGAARISDALDQPDPAFPREGGAAFLRLPLRALFAG